MRPTNFILVFILSAFLFGCPYQQGQTGGPGSAYKTPTPQSKQDECPASPLSNAIQETPLTGPHETTKIERNDHSYGIGDQLYMLEDNFAIQDKPGGRGLVVRRSTLGESVRVMGVQKIEWPNRGYWYEVGFSDEKVGWASESWLGSKKDAEAALEKHAEKIKKEKERRARIEWERRAPERRRQYFVDSNPQLSSRVKSLILDGRIDIDMTTDQVRASWGNPRSITTSTFRYGTHEQWVYGPGKYLYFRNGILDSWQLQTQ